MQSVDQPELDLVERGSCRDSEDPRLPELLQILAAEPDWITAAHLLVKANWPATESNKRQLRDLASQSNGQIISGQRGYRHINKATAEEIMHAANWLEHQAKEMADRATAIRRFYHRLPCHHR